MQVRYTDPEHTQGVITLDGVDYSGPIPPNAGDLRALYDAALDSADITPYAPPAVPPRQWTPLEFMELFTPEERKAIRAVARQNPDIEDWLDLLRASSAVVATDERTRLGLAAMVYFGVLTQERVSEIAAS